MCQQIKIRFYKKTISIMPSSFHDNPLVSLRPLNPNPDGSGFQCSTTPGRGLNCNILISNPHLNLFGDSVQELSLLLPLPHGEIPDALFRQLIEDPTSRGPGHWTSVILPLERSQVIAYVMQIPAERTSLQLESALRVLEHSVADYWNRIVLKQAA